MWNDPALLAADLLAEYGVDVCDRDLMRSRDHMWLYGLVRALVWRPNSAVRARLAYDLQTARTERNSA